MSAFAAVDRSAILGTQQAAPPQSLGVPEVDALVAPQPDEAPEQTLLRTAAIVGVIRRAALPAKRFDAAPDVAPEESLPRCSAPAAADLRMLLDGERLVLLPEWLDLAATFGRRAPEELLPKLLTRGANNASLRSRILRVCGERGRWLAPCDSAWAYATALDDDVANFDASADRAVRVRSLEALRARDAQQARELLERSWPTEGPDDRIALLAALDTNLGIADEEFLEFVRADSRKDVRAVANALLHRLPSSQSAQRAIERAAPLLTVKRSLLRSAFEVALPEKFTPEMAADGLEPKPRTSRAANLGDRAWWLRQLLETVPLAHWRTAFKRSTADLFALARGHEDYAMLLLGAFSVAIASYRDEEALADLLMLAAKDEFFVDYALMARSQFPSARPSEAPFLAAFRNGDSRATELIAAAALPWSIELSAAALAAARSGLRNNGDWQAHVKRGAFFALLEQHVDPRTPGIADGWPESYAAENTRDLVDRLLDTLLFRSAMHAHLEGIG